MAIIVARDRGPTAPWSELRQTEALVEQGSPDPVLEVHQIFARPEWHQRAACRGMDQAKFFPVRAERTRQAKVTRAACAVPAECDHFALTDPQILGVWGGTSLQERHIIQQGLVAAG